MTYDGDSELANLRRKNGREKPWKVPYLGIGNESWGCGGEMTPEYYSDVYKQFHTYAFQYSGNKITKIACGASDSNYDWTDKVVSRAGRNMDGISLHYYTLPTGDWGKKGLATGFGEKEWFETLRRTLQMDQYLTKHDEVMNKYDKQRRIGLVVDEWGCWYDEDPNFKIGMLGQQNTMRDALVAALNLNIFNRHCDRVKIAALAQTVNVLQSILLTHGANTVKTPTYYVMLMYKPHKGSAVLPIEGASPVYSYDGGSIPALDVCASLTKDKRLFISLANSDPHHPASIKVRLAGFQASRAEGKVLSAAALDAANTFEKPDEVAPKPLSGLKVEGGVLEASIPPASVVAVEVR
jgi:alpha-N-arabinofuranosidase